MMYFSWIVLALSLTVAFVPAYGTPVFNFQIQGLVLSAVDGEPISGASILIWGVDTLTAPRLEAEGVTDEDGLFILNVETVFPANLVFVYYDEPSTEGFDTLPAVENINSSVPLHTLNFTLTPASTVVLEGPLRLVDSSSNIYEYRCEVSYPGSDKPISIGSYRLMYGTDVFAQSTFLRIDPNVIIVPAETPFELRLTPTFYWETRTHGPWPWRQSSLMLRHRSYREIRICEGDGFVLPKFETLKLDLRKYTIASDLVVIEELIDALEQNLALREEQGFYTVSERRELDQVKGLEDAVATRLSTAAYEDAYIDIRQAYLSASNLRSKLLAMELEASFSLKQLVSFIALTSAAFSYLFFDQRGRRIISSSLLYAFLLLYLYHIYPGSKVVSPTSFIIVSVVSLLAILLLIFFIPRLAKETKLEEGLPFLTSLGALFSMAKRSLLRRRLRFTLTLTSILILSMSFVALTSASTGYGLLYSPQEWAKVERSGLIVKQIQYTTSIPLMKGRFHEVTDEIADWIGRREGVITVARKAESYPSLEPYGFIGNQSIWGILGIEPSEPISPDIDACIVDGEFIEDGDTALISDYALKEMGGAIGDNITIGEAEFRITGTFDYRIMKVRDLNGELIVPNMMIDLTPGSGPTIVVQPCDYEAIVITSFEQALEIHKDIRVSRIDAIFEEGTDLIKLAKTIALERGIRVWASTGSEVYSAHVGEYFVGKGLPILIPWVIVILNVLMTMLNVMYERREEMSILSSVGLNPSHIAGMFVAEASITGVIGGGFGYLIGLGLYPLMTLLSSAPLVHQKVSAIWSLGAIGVAAAAASVGVIVAIKGSIVLTPSLERRWAIADMPKSYTEPWKIPIPAKISDDEFDDFMAFMKRSLMAHRERTSYPHIASIRDEQHGPEGGIRTLSFWYREGDVGLGGISSSCALTLYRKEGEDFYTAELRSYGGEEDIRKSGNFIRGLTIKWNTERKT